MTLSRQNRARIAWAKSFFKSDWRFEDYPLDYIDQGECSPNLPERLQHKRWRVDLVNWWEMSGQGDTKEISRVDARQKFEARKASGEKMVRPGVGQGSRLPTGPKVIFPENQRIDNYPDLRDHFIFEVLHLPWAWVTDESSLWDFHSEHDNNAKLSRIREVYSVDVSDVPGAKLIDILEKIMTEKTS
jgi:hypothetical protein